MSRKGFDSVYRRIVQGCGVACCDGDRLYSGLECMVRQRDRRTRPLLGRDALHDRVVASRQVADRNAFAVREPARRGVNRSRGRAYAVRRRPAGR
ncbi:hypothetical protein BCEN4_2430010 [Burkholderia cenocepacia]|nr:hypothetical protein BCEN4_2430010 [Burkholderia cenocepacia]